MTESILDQVRRIAADIFAVPFARVTAVSSPDTIENWDSLQLLNLVLTLEQTFELEFIPEEIERMINIESISMLVQEKLSKIP